MGEDVSLNYGLHCLMGFYFYIALNEMYMEGIGLYLVF